MSKSYNIRWKQSDSEDLAKSVKNFNAKISRLEKKYDRQIANATDSKQKQELIQNKNALPEKITVRQMKELIKTRQDLKREINALRRFSKRGAEDIKTISNTDNNIKVTKWQKAEMNRRIAIINRKRKERYEYIFELPAKSGDQELGYTVGQRQTFIGMGQADKVSLQPKTAFFKSMTQSGLDDRYKSILKESQSMYWNQRDLMMKENYMKALLENYNPNDVQDIVDSIRDMDFKEFYEKYQEQGDLFEWASDRPDDDQYEGYVNQLYSIWMPNTK